MSKKYERYSENALGPYVEKEMCIICMAPEAAAPELMGFFEDGWVRAQAAFSVRALDNVTSLSLELWVPPDAEQLTITMRPSNAPEITLAAPAGRVTVLQFPLKIPPLGERRIELTASREQQLSDRDLRQAAYKLGCIGLN